MIYLSDDYMEKYVEVFTYLLSRSIKEEYSYPYIEKAIANSVIANELETSNITTIAFSSCEKIYTLIFPVHDNQGFSYSLYDVYGWMGYVYVHLFIKYQVTFEVLFSVLPIEKLMSLYSIYHEMDISGVYEVFDERVKYSYLDVIMTNKNMSTRDIANKSSLSFSTINALRYGKRDINKLEGYKMHLLAISLRVKITSLLTNLGLSFG